MNCLHNILYLLQFVNTNDSIYVLWLVGAAEGHALGVPQTVNLQYQQLGTVPAARYSALTPVKLTYFVVSKHSCVPNSSMISVYLFIKDDWWGFVASHCRLTAAALRRIVTRHNHLLTLNRNSFSFLSIRERKRLSGS